MQVQVRRLAAIAAAAAAAAGTAALPAAGGAGGSGSPAGLRQQVAELERRSSSALLELYALETRLAGARNELAAARRRADELEAERARTAKRLALARRNAARADALLAVRLRALYESSSVDPLAILLGAASLDDALTGLDGLRFAAERDVEIVAATRRARQALALATRLLRQRSAAAAGAAAAAAARAADLERAHAERGKYVRRLQSERRLKQGALAALEAEARDAQARSRALNRVRAPAAPPADAPPPAPAAPPEEAVAIADEPAAEAGRTLTVTATAYALQGRTATGVPAAYGVVAVDPAVIPLGMRMTVPGYGEGVAADVGGAVRGYHIDVWLPTRAEALAWGRRTVTITIH